MEGSKSPDLYTPIEIFWLRRSANCFTFVVCCPKVTFIYLVYKVNHHSRSTMLNCDDAKETNLLRMGKRERYVMQHKKNKQKTNQ